MALNKLSIYSNTDLLYGHPNKLIDGKINITDWLVDSNEENNARLLNVLLINKPVAITTEEYISVIRTHQYYINHLMSNGGVLQNQDYSYNQLAEIKIINNENNGYATYIANKPNAINIEDFDIKNTDFDKDNWAVEITPATNTIHLAHEPNNSNNSFRRKFIPDYLYKGWSLNFIANQDYTPSQTSSIEEPTLPETNYQICNVKTQMCMGTGTTYYGVIALDYRLNYIAEVKDYLEYGLNNIYQDLFTTTQQQKAYNFFNEKTESRRLLTKIINNQYSQTNNYYSFNLVDKTVIWYIDVWGDGRRHEVNGYNYAGIVDTTSGGNNLGEWNWDTQTNGYTLLSMSSNVNRYSASNVFDREPDFTVTTGLDDQVYTFRPYIKFNGFRDATLKLTTFDDKHNVIYLHLARIQRKNEHFIKDTIELPYCWTAEFDGVETILPYTLQRTLEAMPETFKNNYLQNITTYEYNETFIDLDGYIYPLRAKNGNTTRRLGEGEISNNNRYGIYYDTTDNCFVIATNEGGSGGEASLLIKKYRLQNTKSSATTFTTFIGKNEYVISAFATGTDKSDTKIKLFNIYQGTDSLTRNCFVQFDYSNPDKTAALFVFFTIQATSGATITLQQ